MLTPTESWHKTGREKNLVRLVYFDESGTGEENSQPIVVVAAVVVHGDEEMRGINKDVREIYNLLPSNKRDRFEFKASKLFGHYRKFRDDSKYRRVMTEFLTVMRKYRLPIQWCAIDRLGFLARSNKKAPSLKPQDFAFFTFCGVCGDMVYTERQTKADY
jgi:hypothetical protein